MLWVLRQATCTRILLTLRLLSGCLARLAGRVVLTRGVDAISPDWFPRGKPLQDSGSWQRAVDSCAGACMIMSTRTYLFTKARTRHS